MAITTVVFSFFYLLLFLDDRVAHSSPLESSVTKTISKYIQASPPMLALQCIDGIFCLAIHIPDETLSDNIGPRRIQQIDTASMLLTCGWRTDGMQLADKARELCLEDISTFGTMSTSFTRRNGDYTRRLANGLVEYLVECCVKDNLRTLATVGLLATVTGSSDMSKDEIISNNFKKSQLYFVDCTGMYPCRALAMGMYSDQINRRLIKDEFDSWSIKNAPEKVFQILREECFPDGPLIHSMEEQKHGKIPKQAVVESVSLRAIDGFIQRQIFPYSDISTDISNSFSRNTLDREEKEEDISSSPEDNVI